MARKKTPLAGIAYAGVAGYTKECKDAVLRLLQYGDDIKLVRILTCSNTHALVLTLDKGDLVAIKSGFSSGYVGGGPRGFSHVLSLLDAHNVIIEEYVVDADLIDRVDSSALTGKDIENIDHARALRPTRWYQYIDDVDLRKQEHCELWQDCRPVIPFAILDPRIFDLAKTFWSAPDSKLIDGYRRLEDIVRERLGAKVHGVKLFSDAFLGKNPRLSWKDCEGGEREGRANLFTGAFMAYRNPRAHRELSNGAEELLRELLLLNHLYLLEREAAESEPEVSEAADKPSA